MLTHGCESETFRAAPCHAEIRGSAGEFAHLQEGPMGRLTEEELAQCSKCDQPPAVKSKFIRLCVKHYKFKVMRNNAQQNEKVVPSHGHLEKMVSESNRLLCSHCEKKMVWTRKESTKRVVTLQHDRDGTMRLLCMSCNIRHSNCPDDSFYTIPPDKKLCFGCKSILYKTEFSKDKRCSIGLASYCKKCRSKRRKEMTMTELRKAQEKSTSPSLQGDRREKGRSPNS